MFFGVASPDAWQAIWEGNGIAYRKSPTFKSNFGAVSAWLRQGEIEAQLIDCAPYSEKAFRDALLGPAEWKRFIKLDTYHTKAGIQDFAKKIGIAPGIVVGRLQHENLLPYTHGNDLKQRLEWNREDEDV